MRSEPIRIPSNYLKFAQSVGKDRSYKIELVLVFSPHCLTNLRQVLLANHQA